MRHKGLQPTVDGWHAHAASLRLDCSTSKVKEALSWHAIDIIRLDPVLLRAGDSQHFTTVNSERIV